MKQFFRKIVVLLLIITLAGGVITTYAKNSSNNEKEVVLSEKYNEKKVNRIKDSINQKNDYRFLINTTDSYDLVNNYFSNIDNKIKIKNYSDGNYMIRLPKNTTLVNIADLDNGIIPTTIGKYDMIEPEVVEGFGYLDGEETAKLWGNNLIGADTFQEELQTKEKIKVAILDTGIDYTNTDLDNNYNPNISYDFVNEDNDAMDDNGHGTQIAGIIGAEVNGSGRYGVNSNSDLISLKVLDANGLGTSYDILEAIDYAKLNNIKVINMSFGGIGDPTTSSVCNAINEAKLNGIFTVVSAGNNNTDIRNTIPAGCSGSITVGAIDNTNNKTSFSSYGTGVIFAPGENIYTTSLNNSYINVSGTSFSTAFVSGLVAKELAYSGTLSYGEVVSNVKGNYGLYYNYFLDLNLLNNTVISDDIFFGSGEIDNPVILYSSILNQEDFSINNITSSPYWDGYVTSNGGYYRSVGINTFIKNGRAYIPKSSAGTTYYWTNFELNNLYDLGIEGDDIRIDTMIKSSLYDGAIQARDPCIIVYGEYNNMSLCYMGDAWGQSRTYLGAGTEYLRNSPLLIKNFEYYHVSSLGLKNGVVSAYYDYNKSAGINFSGKIGKIKKIRFLFKGSASFDWLKIYSGDNYLVLYEDFNINGAGNIKTYDLCSYDPKYCISYDLTHIQLGETIIDYLARINEGKTTNPITSEGLTGDPVNLNTGEFIYDNVVMQHNSKGFPFSFELSYKNKVNYDGVLGYNFDFGYNQYLTEQSDGNIYYYNGKLGVFEFVKNGTGFDYNSNLKAELKMIDGKYNLVFDNSKTHVFNTDLKLETISDNFNNTFNFTYNIDGNLETIIDSNFRVYTLNYNANSKLQNIIDFNGNKVEFIYYSTGEIDGNENDLKTIKIINGLSEKEINFTYTISETEELAHNIVKLIDSENNTYVENTYDTDDRVETQTFGNGIITYTYTTDSDGKITQNSIVDREGNNVIYTYDSNGNTIKKVIKKLSGDLEYDYEYNSDNYISKEILPLGNGYTYKYDVNHNLIEKRQKTDINAIDSDDDIVTKITYDQVFNKPTQIINSNGAITNLTLDANGNVTRKEILGIKDVDGNIQTIIENYEYNNAGELVKITDANGNKTNLEYTNGNLVKSTKGSFLNTIETNYNYDTKGNIVSITDPEGNITNLSYDDFNLLNSLTTPEGIVSEYTYNKLNKKTNESIILGDLSKASTSYNYDILDNPTQITKDIDANRQKVIVTKYDKNSNITEIKDGNNATIQFTYNEENFITSKTVVNGTENITTSYIYGENNRLVKQVNPNGSEINFAYDLFDRIVKQTLLNGVYTTLNYDKAGNILETKTYNSLNELLQKESNTYDALNRKTSNTRYDLENNQEITNKTYYDNVGNIVKITSPQPSPQGEGVEGISTFEYDSFNRLSTITDKLGNIITNKYNKNNKLVSRTITGTDLKTITTNYTYDSDNRLISETDNLNQTISYTYNNLNQVTSKTNKDGTITNYKYDYVGNILEETIGTKTTKYEYDINGNRTKVIDANNNITTYEYDSLNRLIKQIYPDGNILTQSYDISGNLIKRTDPNGTIITNNYDLLNRLTSRNIQTGTGVLGATSETYTYDELGRLTSGTDNLGNDVSFNFDSLNRLTNETNSNELVNYTYYVNNNITSINNTNYAYDIANRLISVKNGTQNIADYTYNSLTQLSQTLGNGVTTNYSYDELLRIASLGNYDYIYNTQGNITSDGKDYYSYDNLGRLTGVNYDQVNQPEYNGDKIERFSYDNLGNRTNQENYTLKNISTQTCTDQTVVEDVTLPNGKTKTVEKKKQVCETAITQTEKQKNTINYNTNSLNQYTKLQNLNKNGEVKKEFTYKYDNNGNLIKDDINGYFYDYKNRLVKVIQNEVIKLDENNNIIEIVPEKTITEFTYDILGRRIEKKIQEKTIQYIYAGQNAIKEITTDNTTNQIIETRENIYSNNLDDILSTTVTDYTKEIPETNKYFYEKNHLGSITKITDETGAIVEQYEYDVFGVAYASVNNVEAVTTAQENKTLNIKKANGSETADNSDTDELTIDNIRYKRYNGVGKIGNTRLYTGREYDAELKLYYNRARYYSPDLGRFISRDPIDISDDVNLYAYVGNNGVMFVDRNGEAKEWIKQNEGNAWYFENQDGFHTGHAAMYFINDGNEYLINFNPSGSIGINPSGNGDMFFGTVGGSDVGTFGLDEYREMIISGINAGNSITKIETQYIDSNKLAERYNSQYLTSLYNTFTNNCSDEVEKALEYAGFFENTEIYGLPTPLPGNIGLPGTTPGGLGYDIQLELFYKKIGEGVMNLFQ